MDIKSAEQSFQNVVYKEDSYDELLDHLKNTDLKNDYHLCLFIGKNDELKEQALKQIAEQQNREIFAVDANEIISKIESESFENIDWIFSKFSADDTLLYLKNGSRLCGSYTGYTQSSVKYATPQERYFLKKIQQHGGFFVIDIAVDQDTDNTIRRAAQSIISFPVAQSGFKKMMWKLRQIITVHGHEIKTERPEQYGKQAGNF